MRISIVDVTYISGEVHSDDQLTMRSLNSLIDIVVP